MTPAPSRRQGTTGQLVQSERLHTLGQLVAGVIHEMNNPLTIVNTNLHVLGEYVAQMQQLVALYEAEHPETSAIAAYKAEIDWAYMKDDLPRIQSSIHEGAQRAFSLVDELRRYSAGNSASVTPVDLRGTLASTVRLVESTYRHRVRFELELTQLPPVMGIAGQLQQVFMNLLINACQAIEGEGTVRVRSHVADARVVITVSDSGDGIAPDVLPRIFEPYFSTKSAADGTGLGLPISKRIIEKHGGRLEVASVLGEGTTFTLSLPLDAEPDTADEGTPYAL